MVLSFFFIRLIPDFYGTLNESWGDPLNLSNINGTITSTLYLLYNQSIMVIKSTKYDQRVKNHAS